MNKYEIIYADPAWSFNNKNTGGSMVSGASAHYNDLLNPLAVEAGVRCPYEKKKEKENG